MALSFYNSLWLQHVPKRCGMLGKGALLGQGGWRAPFPSAQTLPSPMAGALPSTFMQPHEAFVLSGVLVVLFLNASIKASVWIAGVGHYGHPKQKDFSQTYVALAPTENLGNGALHKDFKLFISVFYMDISLCINTSQTLYFVLMISNIILRRKTELNKVPKE